jgi:tRNA (guanine-N7-)-methyltransferase
MHAPRHIRSFVLRAGRVTAAQERALAELWPPSAWNWAQSPWTSLRFRPRAPRCLEIGFGVGEVIGSLAESHPDIDYLGLEVHRPGVGRLLLRAERAGARATCASSAAMPSRC